MELILHSICVASIILSVESVCESLTSVYEYHNNKRHVIEETAYHEMILSTKGPLPTKRNLVVLNALSHEFCQQSNWHFV